MAELTDVLPADSLNRVALALANIAGVEARISATTAGYLAILERTITRINAMGAALDALRMPTTSQKINAGVSANTPTPGAGNQQADALLSQIARNTAVMVRLMSAMGKSNVSVNATKEPTATKTPETGDLRGLADALANGFDRAKTSVLGFVGVASPSHFSTLQASISLLSLEIGTVFLPYVEYASRAIQHTATWFRNLDATTKNNITRAALFGATLGGLVIVARQLHAAYVVLRASIIAVNLAMTASPVGAVLKMVGVVAGLAAAWWGVNQAVNAANTGMRSGQVPGGPGGRPAALEMSEQEAAAMPEPYRKQYQLLHEGLDMLANYDQLDARRQIDFNRRYTTQDEQRNMPLGAMNEGIREQIRERLVNRGREIVEAFNADSKSVLSLLAEPQRAEIERDPRKRAEILRDEAAKARKEAEKGFASAPALAQTFERDAATNKQRLEQVAKDPGVLKVVQEQLAAYSRRVNVNPDVAPGTFNDDPRARPEREVIDKAILRAVQKIDPETDVSGEAIRSLRIMQPDPRLAPERGGLAVGESDWIKPFKTLAQLQSKAQTLESRAVLLERAATATTEKRTGNDSFLQNIKSPIQSRFTDAFQFAESAQLAALNTGDADAKILQRQLEILSSSVGDISKQITQYIQRVNAATGENFWRGSIDLGR